MRPFGAAGLLIHLTAESAGKAAVLPLLTELSARYPAGGKGEMRFRFAENIKREGFGSASRVNYVARIGNFRTGGFRYTGALRIAQTMLSYGYLWNEIRSKGGAYGCAVRFGRGGSVVFSSYRDPKLEETDKVYEGVPGYLEQYEADEREMTKAIIGAVGELDTPRTPQLSGLLALSAYYSKVTDEMFAKERAEVLSATPKDIRALAPLVREALKYEAKCVIGNEAQSCGPRTSLRRQHNFSPRRVRRQRHEIGFCRADRAPQCGKIDAHESLDRAENRYYFGEGPDHKKPDSNGIHGRTRPDCVRGHAGAYPRQK